MPLPRVGIRIAYYAARFSSELRYPFSPENNFPFSNSGTETTSPLYGKPHRTLKAPVIYDPVTGQYSFTGKWEILPSGLALYHEQKEYEEYSFREIPEQYWNQNQGATTWKPVVIHPTAKYWRQAFDKVFGSNAINITPSGSAELIFGFNLSKTDNPTLTEKLRKTPSFISRRKS